MKKTLLSTVILTAILTFFMTRYFFLPQQNDHYYEQEQEENHNDHEGESETELELTSDILQEFGIEIGTASGGVLEKTIELLGEIQIDPDRLAHITPRFDGVVKEVFKKIGDPVKKDELLAIIESNESLTTYEIRSSINGIVIDMHFTKGETAQRPDHFFAVADLSEVWVNFSIYQRDLPFIRIGQMAEINSGQKLPLATGTISYISPILDVHTRTATARVILKNPDGSLRPGLFVTGKVIVENISVDVAIPKTALQSIDDQPSLFIKTLEGFKSQVVHLGRTNQYYVEILSGLKPGQEYVSKGGFTLKAQLAKESFGDGHGH